MNLPLEIRPAALAEFEQAIAWYETQSPGLGGLFALEIEDLMETISTHPKRFPKVLGETRQALATKFPYCIYYQVTSDLVVVLAVFHSSRDPSTWKKRK